MKTEYAQGEVYIADGKTLGDDGHHRLQKLGNGVMFIMNLRDLPNIANRVVRLGYNAVVHCIRGRIELEVGGALSAPGSIPSGQKVKVGAGDVLLLPTHKLLQPMMVSTDVEVTILLVSDKVLREVLGPQVNLWNRAMFLDEVYVIDGGLWIKGADNYARTFFQNPDSESKFRLYQQLVLSFLRTLFLMICETLMKNDVNTGDTPPQENSATSGKVLFNRFMVLLSQQSVKRQQVNYYASLLNVTPKYLSTVCKQVSGKSPTRWITESVMDDVYQLLRNTDLSVKEISDKTGFPNPSSFGQYFKEEAGMTPLEYRNKSRQI